MNKLCQYKQAAMFIWARNFMLRSNKRVNYWPELRPQIRVLHWDYSAHYFIQTVKYTAYNRRIVMTYKVKKRYSQ